jgi:hypothetical protein
MKKLSILLMGLLCLSFISALEISSETNTNILVKGVDNSIDLTLEITNASDGLYNVYSLSDISLRPTEMFSISDGYFLKTFQIHPTPGLDVGYYTFTYTLNQRGVEQFDMKFTANVLEIGDVVEVSSDSVDFESGEVSFYVQNKENVELKNLTATFSSILFDTEETFDLGPNEKLEIEVEVDDKKLRRTKSGVYVIRSDFQTDEGIKKVDGTLYLGEKKGITTTEDKGGLLVRTETVTKVNTGNTVEPVEIVLKRNIISRLFSSFNIEPSVIDRKGLVVEYTWVEDKLGPSDIFMVKATTNYVFPFLVIVFAVLVLLGYRRYSETKVEVVKSVSHVRTKNGEFALKVKLAIKAKKSIENLSIIDKIPAIVKIYKKFGMVQPDKIDTENRRIHWNIGDLNAGEERVFDYIVYSKVGVVGKFSLPEALAVFEKDGKIHEIESNKVFFMSDQVKN